MARVNPVNTDHFIRSLHLPNRFVLAPMSRASAHSDGAATENMANYYAKFARGGFGLLITEGAYTDANTAQSYSNQPGMVTDEHESAWRQVVSVVKNEGGKIILQLIHAGAVSQHVEQAYAPSPVRPKGKMLQGYGHKQGEYDVPLALSIEDIEHIVAGFIQAAIRAERAGFDGVEVHCANGYLLDQFLTPETNLRSDQYGGSLANRIRLTRDILTAIKAATSASFVVGVRLSQAKATEPDYFWRNGLDDANQIFSEVADGGADFIHLASEAKGYEYRSATKDGENLTAFAKRVTGLPVIANGGLSDTKLTDNILCENKADFVAIGKAALVNPDLPNKRNAGQELREFTYDIFKYGVSIEAQLRWEDEQASQVS